MKTAVKKKRGFYTVEITQGVQHFDIDYKAERYEAEWMKDRFDEAIGDHNKEYSSQQTVKLKKDLKDAESMFEKMELTAFNLEKRIAKQAFLSYLKILSILRHGKQNNRFKQG